MFFRMHRISDIYFVGGFGTVQWVDVAEYVSAKPDEIVTSDPHHTLQVKFVMTQRNQNWSINALGSANARAHRKGCLRIQTSCNTVKQHQANLTSFHKSNTAVCTVLQQQGVCLASRSDRLYFEVRGNDAWMISVQVLNETYSEGLRQALSRPGSTVDDAAFISIDRLGADVRTRRATDYIVERLTFPTVRAAPN